MKDMKSPISTGSEAAPDGSEVSMQEQVRRLGQSLEDRLKKTVQDSISAGSDGTGKGTDGKGRDGRGRGGHCP